MFEWDAWNPFSMGLTLLVQHGLRIFGHEFLHNFLGLKIGVCQNASFIRSSLVSKGGMEAHPNGLDSDSVGLK